MGLPAVSWYWIVAFLIAGATGIGACLLGATVAAAVVGIGGATVEGIWLALFLGLTDWNGC